jgi:hypothetical protein
MSSANEYDSFDSELDNYDYEGDTDLMDDLEGGMDDEYDDEEEFYDEFAADIPDVGSYSENKKKQ